MSLLSAEYRFLRFEVVGIATISFLLIGLLPMLESSVITFFLVNMNGALAVIAGLFLLSLPLGYGQHQMVVNVYRSHKKRRAVFQALEDMVHEAEKNLKIEKGQKSLIQSLNDKRKNSFLTAILDVCLFSKQSSVDSEIYSRISDRWSHFYARRAVGKYAPMSSFMMWIILLIIGYFALWPLKFQLENFAIAAVWWLTVFWLIGRKIDSYSEKIWFEISYLESSVVLANKEKMQELVSKVVGEMVKNPDYVEKGESYGMAFYKL